ncbi:MAG: hypothetical protein ACE15D_18110 [Candidatus Eisenbacteria bacterium]|nr:hypothetical protein [Candidatus Eisenbacteria bacterium]
MLVLSIVILVLLVLGALAFIAAPLLREQRGARRREEERQQALGAKQRAIQLIRDLDLDRQTGKVEEADWQEQRAALEAVAIEAMRRLDAIGGGDEGDDPIERAIREEREKLRRRGA